LKNQQTVVGGWGGEGRGNSISKAFGISFADRPKAKKSWVQFTTDYEFFTNNVAGISVDAISQSQLI
jgi:hypothetical protein